MILAAEKLAYVPAFTREGEAPIAVPLPRAGSRLPAPYLGFDPAARCWFLVERYFFEHDGYMLTLPPGFTLDLASIPRIAWSLLASHELGLIGPLVHDDLYGCGGEPAHRVDPPRRYTRKQADDLFLAVMYHEGVPWMERRTAYLAVRAFGAGAWRAA